MVSRSSALAMRWFPRLVAHRPACAQLKKSHVVVTGTDATSRKTIPRPRRNEATPKPAPRRADMRRSQVPTR